jgi:hypothetical protein
METGKYAEIGDFGPKGNIGVHQLTIDGMHINSGNMFQLEGIAYTNHTPRFLFGVSFGGGKERGLECQRVTLDLRMIWIV